MNRNQRNKPLLFSISMSAVLVTLTTILLTVHLLATGQNNFKEAVASEYLLVSNYFTNDTVAKEIANGTVTSYTFSGLAGINGFINESHRTNYQYKIYSALKMLGYGLGATQSENTFIRNVTAFQKQHNLATGDVITKEFMIALDQEIYKAEQSKKQWSSRFPIDTDYYSSYLGSNVTYIANHEYEPPKDDARYFYSYLLSQLPSSIAPLTEDNMSRFFIKQAYGVIYYDSNSQRWILNYIPSALPLSRGTNYGIYTATWHTPHYLDKLTTVYHEFAHHIDRDLNSNSNPVVDTTTFYQIMFQMDTCVNNSIGWKTCLPKPVFHYVSQYSDGWENQNKPGYYSIYESFAEAFAMYVIQGELFRELTTVHADYQLVYDWLKTNVFGGREYCTGDVRLIKRTSPYWDYQKGDLPSGVADLIEAYKKDHINDSNPIVTLEEYMLNGPLCSPPSLSPTPSPRLGGDVNGDGHVSLLDLSALLSSFGTTVGINTGADFNGDGVVNLSDLIILLGNYGL